ncbi:MAG: T9SS type A sorting domain-containing protein, partial [Bacteroidetes bacterium]|nr:T9SS type A sorting domain-containing protein [Bacteroidota bacterium]
GATNSDRLAFHVNGVAQALTFTGTIPAATLVTSPPADLVLGCEHNGPGTQLQFLNGQFGELRIWDHAMSALEIVDRMPFEVAGTEPGLLEYFRFADGAPGGDNTGIASFAGGHGVSTIVPVGLAMTGAASNFTGAPATTGAIDVSVAVAGHILTAAAAGATYQWLDCDNGLAPIPGATAQSYTTTADGNYAVTITQGGCSATSACVAVVTTGITTADASGWTVHPNPVEDRLFVELGNGAAQPFAIMDPAGRVVRQGQVIGRAIIPVEDLTPGIYLLRIGTGSAKVFERK